ncbi:MAG: LysM peptidoglycan-binding domain-containing protein [Anaerolineaceae bacterium]|nr:LysM peptidoglycan-binding domain-containing protein [Anaerolineaceae bacterium]
MRRSILLITLLALMLAFGTTAYAQAGEVAHTVQPGENLFRISLRYNVAMATIAARNGINNWNLIFAGTVIYVPTSGTTPAPATPVPTTPTPPTTVEYIVKAGDTLSNIARQFNTTVQALAQLNNIVNPNLIYPGTKLLISGTPTTPTHPARPPRQHAGCRQLWKWAGRSSVSPTPAR